MHGSDEEADDPPEVDSDEDLSDDGDKHVHEEVYIKSKMISQHCT